MKNTAMKGAVVGAGVAMVLLTLECVRPFSPNANAFVERLTFKLCPFYILSFTTYVSKEWTLIILTILGNAVLYGIAFWSTAAVAALVKQL